MRTPNAVLLAIVLLTACGGGAGGPAGHSAGPRTPEPCSLLTTSELANAFRESFDAPIPIRLGPPYDFHECIWDSTQHLGQSVNIAAVRTLGKADIDPALFANNTPRAVFDMERAPLGGVDVPGLGDQAYVAGGNDFHIMELGVLLVVQIPGATDDYLRQATLALARKACSRL